jgi:hypothetical protein
MVLLALMMIPMTMLLINFNTSASDDGGIMMMMAA